MTNLENAYFTQDKLEEIKKNSENFGVIGICGVFGNLVARILVDNGFNVIGSDLSVEEECRFSKSLEGYDIEVFYGKTPDEFFNKIDYVFLPPSLTKDSNLYKNVLSKNIPILTKEDVFNMFIPSDKTICISGTNGKTTTTTVLKHIAYYAGLNPTEHNLDGMQGNNEFIPALQARLNGDVSILETGTDGTKGELKSLLSLLDPSSGILTNVTPDHLSENLTLLDYAKIKGELINSLNNKQLIVNSDDPTIMGLIKNMDYVGDLVTFGLDEKPSKTDFKPCFCGRDIEINEIISGVGYYKCECGVKYEKPDYIAKDISLKSRTFTVSSKEGDFEMKMGVDGLHNVYNCLGAIVASREFFNIPYETIREALPSFTGVGGRMEFIKNINNKKVMIDYAHNPAGVETVLREFKKIYGDFTVVVTVSSESGIEGDISIMNNALEYAKYIVPASHASRKILDKIIKDNPNLINRFKLTKEYPEEFKEKTLGSNESNLIDGLNASLETPVDTIIVIGEAAIKFKSAIVNF